MTAWEPGQADGETGSTQRRRTDRNDPDRASLPDLASPPREWRFFESGHRGQEYPPLSIQEAEIIVLPLDDEEDFITWTENVDRDIQMANECTT